MNEALEMPERGAPAGFKRFKRYALLMATIDGLPTVLVVEHLSRLPGFWLDRPK
jgi:hypothetical protein